MTFRHHKNAVPCQAVDLASSAVNKLVNGSTIYITATNSRVRSESFGSIICVFYLVQQPVLQASHIHNKLTEILQLTVFATSTNVLILVHTKIHVAYLFEALRVSSDVGIHEYRYFQNKSRLCGDFSKFICVLFFNLFDFLSSILQCLSLMNAESLFLSSPLC